MSEFLILIATFFLATLKIGGNMRFLPPLSKEEERTLFEKMHQGDKEARASLIEHNLRLVAHIVKKYSGQQDQDDLLSIGTVGLIKAIDNFDPKNGARFATYASKCLQNEVFMYFRAQKKLAGEVSINEPIDTDKNGNPLTYMDVVSYDDDICEMIDERIKSAKALRAVAGVLNKRERQIICMRYGLFGQKCYTQKQIAEKMDISRSYVSRIEKQALAKLEKEVRK